MAVLVGFWLKEPAADTIEGLADQYAKAQWLEERMFNNLAKVMGVKE